MLIRILASLLLAAPLALNPALAGGEGDAQPADDQTVLERNQVSEGDLDRFAEAQIAVEEVRKDYFAKLRAAEELPADKDQLQKDMARDISNAVKDAAISSEDYKRISEAARQDMRLRNMIFQRMQAKVSEAEGQKVPTN